LQVCVVVASFVLSVVALWAVFWAPPSDPTDIGGVVIDARCYLFAALVAVFLWLIAHFDTPCG
jgi:hypothetical protein